MKSLQRILLVSIICLSTIVSIAQTGIAFKQNKRLGRGVNIIGYDPIWKDSSKARMQNSHFKMIKEAGFSNVRIVISLSLIHI